MLLIPAIALQDGKCAGVIPGNDPAPEEALRVAATWIAAGVRRLHVEDGDAGAPGKRAALAVVRALAEAHPEIHIQVAGNFRDGDTVALYLGAGAEYVVLDSRAAGAGHFVNDLCLECPGHVLMNMEARMAMAGRSKLARHP
ncbi:MAG: HisA/HisF-related TIM barrel protein, partial [Rhizomicrobium sp.]